MTMPETSRGTRGGKRPGAGRPPLLQTKLNRAEGVLDAQRKAWRLGTGRLAEAFDGILERLILLARTDGHCPHCGKVIMGFRSDKEVAQFLVDRFSRIMGTSGDNQDQPMLGIAKLIRELAKEQQKPKGGHEPDTTRNGGVG